MARLYGEMLLTELRELVRSRNLATDGWPTGPTGWVATAGKMALVDALLEADHIEWRLAERDAAKAAPAADDTHEADMRSWNPED